MQVGADPLLRAPASGLHSLAAAVKYGGETMDGAEALISKVRTRMELQAAKASGARGGGGGGSSGGGRGALTALLNQFDERTGCNLALLEGIRSEAEDWVSYLLAAGCQVSKAALDGGGGTVEAARPTYVRAWLCVCGCGCIGGWVCARARVCVCVCECLCVSFHVRLAW